MKTHKDPDGLNRLASKMKKGDEKAAVRLYEKLASKTFGFFMNRLASREAAEDLTQDVFIKLLDHIDSFDERKGNFVVWFWQVARNSAIDYYRKKREDSLSDVGEVRLAAYTAENYAALLDAKIKSEAVRGFVSSLDEDEKDLFELRFIAENSYSELSEILGKSEGSLRVAVSRLKQKIKKNLA